MEHSIHHHQAPQPPPRYESYLTNGSFRQQFGQIGDLAANGDSSAFSNMYLYEEHNSDLDKDDRNRSLHKGFHMYSPPNTPPEPAPPDHHLLTPSSILRQLKEGNPGASQSSLEEINCK